MNSGKSRISARNELREMKFQKCLSNTILYQAKKEDNNLRKLQRQINCYRQIFFVCVFPYLSILKLILTAYLILMISDNFVNTNIRHGCQSIPYNGNNRSCHFNVFREESGLSNSFLTVAGIVEFFIKARMTKRFPRVAKRENIKFKTQKPRKKLLLQETSLIQASDPEVTCSSVQPQFYFHNLHVFVVVTDIYINYPSVYQLLSTSAICCSS